MLTLIWQRCHEPPLCESPHQYTSPSLMVRMYATLYLYNKCECEAYLHLFSTLCTLKCVQVSLATSAVPRHSKTQWSYVKSVYLCVPATCLCYGPRWRRILLSLPAQEAWSDLRVERSSRSSCTLLVFICSVYAPYNEYGWSMVWFYVVYRSVSKLHTVRQQENSLTMFFGHGGIILLGTTLPQPQGRWPIELQKDWIGQILVLSPTVL